MSKNPFSNTPDASSKGRGGASTHIPASARVYNELRSLIISLELPPGATLARAELAERFEVSQSPIREAITRLELDGLVISYPQARTVVSKIDIERIREEHFHRTAVECEVVRTLATAYEPSAIVQAKGFVKMQEALAADLEQVALFKQLDEAFHAALFDAVGQSNLHQHLISRCGDLARVRTLDLPREGKMSAVQSGHQRVIDAIESRDGVAAADAMREHLSDTMSRVPNIVEDNKDMFV